MKETPIFEEAFLRLVRQQGILLKIIVGGLLSFIPIINLFAFGYLYRFSGSIRRSGSLGLPDWSDWKGMFVDGLWFAVPWLAFWLLPVVVISFLSGFIGAIGLGAVAYLLFAGVLLVSPWLFSAALYRLQMRQDFRDLLDLPLIFKLCYAFALPMLVPALALFGIGALLLPLYGFAFFVGALVLIAYSTLCYRVAERPEAVSI